MSKEILLVWQGTNDKIAAKIINYEFRNRNKQKDIALWF